MRKFHLLQAEWRLEHKFADLRFFRLMNMWAEKQLDAGKIFPFLADSSNGHTPDDALDEDESKIFQPVAASLGFNTYVGNC